MYYPVYTYDSSKLTPFVGSFKYVGHYDIFGGGNGISSVTQRQNNNWWKGNWGGNSYWDKEWTTTQYGGANLPRLQGKQVKADGTISLLSADTEPDGNTNKFRSISCAEITWTGNIERAFLSIGWYRGDDTNGHFKFTLKPPKGESTSIVFEDTDVFTNDPRPPENETTTTQWRILSFEVTDFIRSSGQGTYTMTLEITPAGSHTSLGYAVPDMGFSIYGVTQNAAQPVSAIAGIVDEKMISEPKILFPLSVI